MGRHLLALLLSLALLSACKKDDFAYATCDEVDALAAEIVATVKNADDPKAGTDAAQALLDAKSAELGPKVKELRELRAVQLGEDASLRTAMTLLDAVNAVEMMKIDYLEQTMRDKELDAKLDKLTADFVELLGG